jgi:hypothetical protein
MELKFSSENEAIQYLANVTGKKIKIADDTNELLTKEEITDKLYDAIESHNAEEVKNLIDELYYAHIYLRGDDFLIYPIQNEDEEIIKLLFESRRIIFSSDTVLFYAIETKNEDIINLVADYTKGSLRDSGSGSLWLNLAIEREDKEIIKLVLEFGGEIDRESLNKAVGTNDKEIVQIILDAGAKPNRNTLNRTYAWKLKPNKDIIKLILDEYKKHNIEIPEKDLQKANEILGETNSTLAFGSTSKAIQYLANVTNKSIKIATKDPDDEEDEHNEYFGEDGEIDNF